MNVYKKIAEIILGNENEEHAKYIIRNICLENETLDLSKYSNINLVEQRPYDEYAYWIFEIGGNYYKVEGSYTSWSGLEVYEDDIYEVKPVMVEVRQWHRV